MEVSTIWGDNLAYAQRSVDQPPGEHGERAEKFYQEQTAKQDIWRASLASLQQLSQENIDQTFKMATFGVLFFLWALLPSRSDEAVPTCPHPVHETRTNQTQPHQGRHH